MWLGHLCLLISADYNLLILEFYPPMEIVGEGSCLHDYISKVDSSSLCKTSPSCRRFISKGQRIYNYKFYKDKALQNEKSERKLSTVQLGWKEP